MDPVRRRRLRARRVRGVRYVPAEEGTRVTVSVRPQKVMRDFLWAFVL